MFSQKNLIRIALNSLLGVVLIYFWFKLIDFNHVLEELKRINYFSLFPFVLFFLLAGVLRALRLKLLLSDFKLKLKDLIPLTYLAQLLSFTIPLRLGEISKAVYLSTEYKLDFSKSIIWILLDRFLDFWVLLVMVFVLLLFIPTNLPSGLQQTLVVLIMLFSLAGSLALFLPNITKKIVNILSHILIFNFLKKLTIKLTDFLLDTTSLLKKGVGGMSSVFLLTALALISDGLGWYVIFASLNETNLPKIFLGSLLSSLTYLIPAAPGYVGSAEAAGLAVFSYGMGIDKGVTSVVTVVAHGLTLLCLLVAGVASLYFLKFDLKLVFKKLRKDK